MLQVACILACVRAWTEHSERCWLTSCAALLGVSRERREFLGRWRVFSSGDEYVRTARSVVTQLQREVVIGVLANSADGVRDIGLSELESYLQQCGEDVGVIAEQLRLLQPGKQVLPPPISPAEDDCSVPPPAAVPADHQVSDKQAVDESFKYFVCITKNRRLRRLHRWGKCSAKPGSTITAFEGYNDLQGVHFDYACRHCWSGGNIDESGSSDSTDASLASSSSSK